MRLSEQVVRLLEEVETIRCCGGWAWKRIPHEEVRTECDLFKVCGVGSGDLWMLKDPDGGKSFLAAVVDGNKLDHVAGKGNSKVPSKAKNALLSLVRGLGIKRAGAMYNDPLDPDMVQSLKMSGVKFEKPEEYGLEEDECLNQ